jgi:glycopeptide antibiotics resistance protein
VQTTRPGRGATRSPRGPLLLTGLYALLLVIALLVPTSAPHQRRGYLRDTQTASPRLPLDIALNITGFLPLGFGLAATGRRLAIRPWAAVLLTTLVAGVFSLTMESIQYLLPQRYSSLIDVLTNATGGALGALAEVIGQRAWNSPGARRQT